MTSGVIKDQLKLVNHIFLQFCLMPNFFKSSSECQHYEDANSSKVNQGHIRLFLNYLSKFNYGPILMKICINAYHEDTIFS